MHCCRKIDGNKFSMFLNFFDVISGFFFFSMFFFYVLSFCIMFFYIFAFLCFVVLCFVIDPMTLSLGSWVMCSAHHLTKRNIQVKFHEIRSKGSGDMEWTQNSRVSPLTLTCDLEKI